MARDYDTRMACEEINHFWSIRGYRANARVGLVQVKGHGQIEKVVSDLVDGLPPHFLVKDFKKLSPFWSPELERGAA